MTNGLIAARDRFCESHTEERVTISGREWGVMEAGSGGPALLLMPGTLGRSDIFFQQIERLEGRARIVAVSYPASGGVPEWAGDLAALLKARDVARATICGSSLGGFLAQYFAATQPGLTERIVPANTLASTSTSKSRPPYTSDIDTAPIEELRAGFGKGLGAWREAHPDQAELVELLLAEAGGRILEGELRARLNALKQAPELPDLELPPERITTIEADDDPLITPEMREEVRARLRPAVSYRFRWGGHFPYLARPAAYLAILEEALGLDITGETWGEGEARAQ